MSQNLCPKCHRPIRIPQEEVTIIRKQLGRGKTMDHMAHKVCPTGEIVDMAGKAMPAATVSYCTQCGHPEQLHAPKCTYTSYGQECDCKHYHR